MGCKTSLLLKHVQVVQHIQSVTVREDDNCVQVSREGRCIQNLCGIIMKMSEAWNFDKC